MRRLTPLLLLGLFVATGTAARADDEGRWTVRDVAAGSGSAGLSIEESIGEGGIRRATVRDASGQERAVTLAFVVPVEGEGWVWHDDPARSRAVKGEGTFENVIDVNCGATGRASLYPLAVISRGGKAVVLAVPPVPARMVRFVMDGGRHELRAEFDFGLSPASERFKSCGDAAVVTFEVPAKWAFRRAFAEYWKRWPDVFARRPGTPEGIWLPFGDIRAVERPEDFGIRVHEAADHQVRGADAKALCDADAKAGCVTLPYVEPPTYWQDYHGDKSHGYAERLKQLEAEAGQGSAVARATLVSGIVTAKGARDLYLGKVAYTTLAPWGSDANPDIPASGNGWPSKGRWEMERLGEVLGWGKEPNPGTDGVYVDSLEGWGTIQNYDKDHWRVTRFPLTFDPSTQRVCLWNFWGTYSFVEDVARKLHADGKLLMANDAYFHFWYACPWVDVPGREYTWTDKEGKLAPVADERYFFFKAMSGRRPYLMLMNNRYEDAAIMEPYFQRSLFWGVYPSMFQGHTSMGETAYFSNPAWFNRDRELFKKYIPMIRELDRAGWGPVTGAEALPADVRVERFGTFAEGTLAFTVHNPGDEDRDVTVTIDPRELGISGDVTAVERISGSAVKVEANVFRLTMRGRGYAMVTIRRATPPL